MSEPATGPALRGTPVVPGIAYGPALVVGDRVATDAVARFESEVLGAEAALSAYDDAVEAVAEALVGRADRATGAAHEVLSADAVLARDPGLRALVRARLREGSGLLSSIDAAVEDLIVALAGTGGRVAERVSDLCDIRRRLVAHLVGAPEPGVSRPDAPAILLAGDLAASDAATLDPAVVLALVTERGGPTSHTSIIVRQLGIPCVVGAVGALEITAGTPVLVDGTTGHVHPRPDAGIARERVERDRDQRAELASWTGPGRTADGVHIELLANVADAETARASAADPVEGVGLFRTELAFLGRVDEPSVEEQTATYVAVLTPYVDRHVVVRTLDAGADKRVDFATGAGETPTPLGMRGLRLSYDDPGPLSRQLDAVAAAAEATGTPTRVMAPMVATVAEASRFAAAVRARGLVPGVMVEVPAAALLADRMLEVVDFLSVGTNDLTQYTMAADRRSADLAHLTDAWQPAVLRLVATAAEAGRATGKPVGVCGEAAAEPLLACVLVGMGVTSLSMGSSAVRLVGARLAGTGLDACQEAAEAALAAVDPASARDAVRRVLGL